VAASEIASVLLSLAKISFGSTDTLAAERDGEEKISLPYPAMKIRKHLELFVL
jgi:hypothetical protein